MRAGSSFSILRPGVAIGVVMRVVMGVVMGVAACSDRTGSASTASRWTVSPESVVRIGVAEGASYEQLYQVRAAARLEDGTVAVANGGSAEIRLFDRTGRFIRSIGGRGEGPGEFAFLQRLLVLRGDTILAGNVNMMARFDRNGVFLDARRMDWTFLSNATHFPEWSWPLPDGASVVQLLERSRPQPHWCPASASASASVPS